MALRKKTKARANYKTQLRFTSAENFQKYVDFEKMLTVIGGNFEDSLIGHIDLCFLANKNLVKGKKPLLNRLVNNKQLVNEVEKAFGVRPIKQEVEYYRKTKWRIGRHYFKRKVNERSQYLYDLPRVIRSFKKIVVERKKREKNAAARVEKQRQANGLIHWALSYD